MNTRLRTVVLLGFAYLGVTSCLHAANTKFIGGVTTDTSGNVYVTGSSLGSGGTGLDYATVKYNSSGTQQWASRYNGTAGGDDIAYAIAVDGSGNVYVTGSSLGSGGTGLDYATVKYNSSGTQQWAAIYNGTAGSNDIAYAIAIDSSLNVYVTGSSLGSSVGLDYATLKYNSSGTQQWASRYNGLANGDDIAYAMAVDSSLNVYVTGSSLGSSVGLDYATVKYNSSGTQQWASRYNGPANGDDIAYAMAVDASNNVYVTGSSLGSSVGLDYATVKYNSSGTQQWASRYDGTASGDDIATLLKFDLSGSIVSVSGGCHDY